MAAFPGVIFISTLTWPLCTGWVSHSSLAPVFCATCSVPSLPARQLPSNRLQPVGNSALKRGVAVRATSSVFPGMFSVSWSKTAAPPQQATPRRPPWSAGTRVSVRSIRGVSASTFPSQNLSTLAWSDNRNGKKVW